DVESGHECATLQGHRRAVQGIALTPDDKYLVSVGADKVALIWDVTTEQIIQTIKFFTPLLCVAITPRGQTVFVGDENGQLHYWPLSS
ncbi:MAG: hypothetical protein KDE56_18845, partial [Anaerolineales bacterium]|nr:hypothetical protein [Anaerolineales bacterium]